jgi:glycosyltransferase involved in cell wall biosynthesis
MFLRRKTHKENARGSIDVPDLSNSLPRALIGFRGWALKGETTFAKIQLEVNGAIYEMNELRLERPDVPINLGEPLVASNCGWKGLIDLSGLDPGELNISLLGVDESGTSYLIRQVSTIIRDDSLVAQIISPTGPTVSQQPVLQIVGSARMANAIRHIEVYCDGRFLGRANVSLYMPGELDFDPSRPHCFTGFEFRLSVEQYGILSGRICLTATDISGEQAMVGSFELEEFKESVMDLGDQTNNHNAASNPFRFTHAPETSHEATFSEMPNALVFAHSLDLGGAQLYLLDLLTILKRHLGVITVVSPFDGPLRKELEKLDIQVLIVGRGIWESEIQFRSELLAYAALIKALRVKIVIANTLGPFYGIQAAALMSTPSIWAIHESFYPSDWVSVAMGAAQVSGYYLKQLLTSLNQANFLVFESDETRALFSNYFSDKSRAVTIPYGVAPSGQRITEGMRQQLRSSYGLSNGQNLIVALVVGVFDNRKAIARVIEAFCEVADELPGLRFLLIGDKEDDYGEELKSIIPSELESRIDIIAITPDLDEYFQISDFLISASSVESIPRSMIQAMQFELPVVAVDAFGVKDLVVDEETGYLIEDNDLLALVNGIRRITNLSSELRREMGRLGHQRVNEVFSLEAWESRFQALLSELLERPGNSREEMG